MPSRALPSRLLDERSGIPLRQVIGRLLEESECAVLAIGRIRLGALDLSEEEVRGPSRCRVLLGQLDASTLLDAAPSTPRPSPAIRRLARWLGTDRLEVRSAGIGSWTPDFSVFQGRDGGATCLVGAHYFGSPQLTVGPSVTVMLRDDDAARLLHRRFQELWDGAHDVAPAIMEVLERGGQGARDGGP